MDNTARNGVAGAAAGDASSSRAGVHLLRPKAKTPAADQRAPGHSVLIFINTACLLRATVAVLVGYTLAATAWRARRDTQDLAFVAFASVLLAALLVCLLLAERMATNSTARERRRVQAAVWVLSAVLSSAFAYGVAGVMPPALAVLVWCMTALVVLAGFFLLVLCEDQRYEDIRDAASGRKAYTNITPHELV